MSKIDALLAKLEQKWPFLALFADKNNNKAILNDGWF